MSVQLIWLGWFSYGQDDGPASRHATSDNLTGYVHWIDLYDDRNQRVDPVDNPRPYSPLVTCGRCHDVKTIAHGWHFNAALSKPIGALENSDGRAGQPLIWNDPRTGTHLPLSYRGWKGSFQPSDLGLTNWQIAAQMGGYLPGVNPTTPQGIGHSNDGSSTPSQESADGEQASTPREKSDNFSINRSNITGTLNIDCMLCHFRPGSGYSPFVWSEQIAEQNFAYAPTAALGIGVVAGGMRRLKDDFDKEAEGADEQLPKVAYEANRFRSDGKVFIDLIRRPSNDACYYCHTELEQDAVRGNRFLHDQDIHLRAGMLCVDCHRNGLDHATVRGFEGEVHLGGERIEAFSCRGCHLGQEPSDLTRSSNHVMGSTGGGRLGAPRPEHKGLPPLHLEKLSCTACHSGPSLASEVPKRLHSIGNELGHHARRTGDELPAIMGNVMLPLDSQGALMSAEGSGGKYTPMRMLWPSYWGTLKDGKLSPLNPEQVYALLRRPLKLRSDFRADLFAVEYPPLSKRIEILGDEAEAKKSQSEMSAESLQKINVHMSEMSSVRYKERMLAGLSAIEDKFPGAQAVYVDGGVGVARDKENNLIELPSDQLGGAGQPYFWPAAHAVRPARQSLGATGCAECHSEESPFFFASVKPIGVLRGTTANGIPVHSLQEVDTQRLVAWSNLFKGRSLFKMFGLLALGLTVLVSFAAFVSYLKKP